MHLELNFEFYCLPIGYWLPLWVDPAEKVDAVTLLYYMAPWAAGIVLVAALLSEGLKPFRLLDPRLLVAGTAETSSTGNVNLSPAQACF